MHALRWREIDDPIGLGAAIKHNDQDRIESFPDHIERDLVRELYQGHVLCHVFNQNSAMRTVGDANYLKDRILGS